MLSNNQQVNHFEIKRVVEKMDSQTFESDDEIGSDDSSNDSDRIRKLAGLGGDDNTSHSSSELKAWRVVIMNNYYNGKYPSYGVRPYYVLASSSDEAKQVVLDNADSVLQDLLSMKLQSGKKVLPRSSALRITPERIGKIEDGTISGRLSTSGYKRMFSPTGVMLAKLSDGAVADMKPAE